MTSSSAGPSLLLPIQDIADPLLSIVIPALNEEKTIEEFVGWCHEGMETAGVKGEILIVDSSSDHTAHLALAKGARVLRSPKRGLGRAYIDAIPYIRGDYVLMGDCDLTYDFRELTPFMEQFRKGSEFIMGSRFTGYIEPGAMPPHHRYFGTPGTTWILNVLYSTRFTDIHCGMRGLTKSALVAMDLSSQGWEYASEMVLKSVHMALRTAEVPVRFYKDREGRLSHHKRTGWFSPWLAAWVNMRAMFVYGAEFFLLRPGVVLLAFGLTLTLPLSFGPVKIGSITFSLYWMLAGFSISVVGLQLFYLGCIAQVVCDYVGKKRSYWLRVFSYDRSVLLSGVALLSGAALSSLLVRDYIRNRYALATDLAASNYLFITGLLFMVGSFLHFVTTLVINLTALHVKQKGTDIATGQSS